MKAIVQYQYGSSDHLYLEDVVKPKIGENEVLIEVYAANVSSGDMRINTLDVPFGLKWIMRLVFGWKRPRQVIRGITAAGQVVAIGNCVSRFKIGDRVNFINSMKASCMAQYIALRETKIISKIGNNVSYVQAAPIAFGAMSAYHFINESNIKKDYQILIYGASGSVGSYAVQLAKHFKANVTAVCSGKNHVAIKSIGADYLIDYTKTNIKDVHNRYDVIFDAVAKLKKAEVKKLLKPKGKFLSIKTPTKEMQDRLDYMNELMSDGHIVSLIDYDYPLELFREAHDHVYSKHKVGNVTIIFK
jgi:NADPH:quinone reductase-like Zn-dependent oxidoreductase